MSPDVLSHGWYISGRFVCRTFCFFVSIETDKPTNIFGWFLKLSWAEEKGQESSGTGRGLRRVVEVNFWRSAKPVPQLFFKSANDLVVCNIADAQHWFVQLLHNLNHKCKARAQSACLNCRVNGIFFSAILFISQFLVLDSDCIYAI